MFSFFIFSSNINFQFIIIAHILITTAIFILFDLFADDQFGRQLHIWHAYHSGRKLESSRPKFVLLLRWSSSFPSNPWCFNSSKTDQVLEISYYRWNRDGENTCGSAQVRDWIKAGSLRMYKLQTRSLFLFPPKFSGFGYLRTRMC